MSLLGTYMPTMINVALVLVILSIFLNPILPFHLYILMKVWQVFLDRYQIILRQENDWISWYLSNSIRGCFHRYSNHFWIVMSTVINFRLSNLTRDWIDVMEIGKDINNYSINNNHHGLYAKEYRFFLVTAVILTNSISIITDTESNPLSIFFSSFCEGFCCFILYSELIKISRSPSSL